MIDKRKPAPVLAHRDGQRKRGAASQAATIPNDNFITSSPRTQTKGEAAGID